MKKQGDIFGYIRKEFSQNLVNNNERFIFGYLLSKYFQESGLIIVMETEYSYSYTKFVIQKLQQSLEGLSTMSIP